MSEYLNITRQAVNKHLKELISKGLVLKEGNTRGAAYKLAGVKNSNRYLKKFKKTCILKDLEEDLVYQEIATLLNLNKRLNQNTREIVHYCFTEILNNAIDHSISEKCEVAISLDFYDFKFRIRDFGMGLFHTIASKFELADETASIGELLKGKTTTMQDRHTGEGIFFSSKSSDKMSFKSHKIRLSFDNHKKDVFVEDVRFFKGTEVLFSISKRSKKSLESIFSQYAPEEFDYRFEKTRVHVKLFHTDYVSRSEARRLLHGLDKFKEIVLDFSGVKSIGQGFADEIFRVYRKSHPDIQLKVENISPVLEPVILHVVDNKNSDRLTIS